MNRWKISHFYIYTNLKIYHNSQNFISYCQLRINIRLQLIQYKRVIFFYQGEKRHWRFFGGMMKCWFFVWDVFIFPKYSNIPLFPFAKRMNIFLVFYSQTGMRGSRFIGREVIEAFRFLDNNKIISRWNNIRLGC